MERLLIMKRPSVSIVSMGTIATSLIAFALLLQSASVNSGASSKKAHQVKVSPLDAFQELKKTDTCGAVGIDDSIPGTDQIDRLIELTS